MDAREAERRRTEHTLNKPFIPIYNYPSLIQAVLETDRFMGLRREIYKLEPRHLSSNNIRLLEDAVYDEGLGMNFPENSIASWHPACQVGFVRFNPQEYAESPYYQFKAHIITIHELVHGSMKGPGLGAYSESLNEGLTDVWTEEIMKKCTLERLAGKWHEEGQEDYPGYHELILMRSMAYSLVHHIQREVPTLYTKLANYALAGDGARAKDAVRSVYGQSIADALENKGAPLHDLMNRMRTLRTA